MMRHTLHGTTDAALLLLFGVRIAQAWTFRAMLSMVLKSDTLIRGRRIN